MIVKVCGIKQNEDLVLIANSGADYVGFIFYPPSSRYAAGTIDPQMLELLERTRPNLKRVGVFVNEDEDNVRRIAEQYHLNTLQFHGEESADYCGQFKNTFTVIKAMPIQAESDFEKCNGYTEACDYFLFDTAGPLYGGNGYGWDWSLLANYAEDTPFLVSGGIGPADLMKVAAIRHPQFAGIDINSGFEKYPGAKNTDAIKSFIRIIKAGEYAIQGQ